MESVLRSWFPGSLVSSQTGKDPGDVTRRIQTDGFHTPTGSTAQSEVGEVQGMDGRVCLNIYDLSAQLRQINSLLDGISSGAYHTGVVVFGREYYYSGADKSSDSDDTGVFWHEPRQHEVHHFRESVDMGITPLTESEAVDVILGMSLTWHGSKYDLVRRNCTHFAEELCRNLQVSSLPARVKGLSQAGAGILDGAKAAADSVHGGLMALGLAAQDLFVDAADDEEVLSPRRRSFQDVLPIINDDAECLVHLLWADEQIYLPIQQGAVQLGRCNDLQHDRFVVLNHPSVSRHHATVCTGKRDDQSVWISVQDVGSLNGIRFFRDKSRRLEPYVSHELRDQDVIFFGEARVLVLIGSAPLGCVVSKDGRVRRDTELFPPPRAKG